MINVWRLIAHHQYPAEMAEWSRRRGMIAVGWGGTKNLNQRHCRNIDEMKQLVKSTHLGSSTSNWVDGSCSLWRLYNEVQKDDLVIVSASSHRALTMRVTGDYHFVSNDPTNSYEHRRTAEATQIDPNWLWHFAAGKAPGTNIRHTLVPCARTLTEAEYQALL